MSKPTTRSQTRRSKAKAPPPSELPPKENVAAAAQEDEGYIFDPPLPNLWSGYEPSAVQLAAGVEGAAAQLLYDKVLGDFKLERSTPEPHRGAVPRHLYGSTGIVIPALSLGGFMSVAMTVMRNRKLRWFTGCGCKATHYVGVHAVLAPLVLMLLPWLRPSLPMWLLPAASLPAWAPAWAGAALLSVGAPVLWSLCAMVVLSWFEHPYHCDELMDYSHAIGCDHVETARHYMESEAQLRPLLRKRRARGQDWIVQTKIRPYAVDPAKDKNGDGALYKTARSSLETMGMEESGVDLLTIHGVNIKAHVDAVMVENGCMDQVERCKKEGLCKAIGFAGHAHVDDLVRMIATDRMQFVNLHYGFFSSYTNVDNQPAVLAAAERGMGIYAISPSNQGGELHKPPPKLVELCAPLHPLEFALLYLFTHRGIGDLGTVSCGPVTPLEFDRQLRALKLVPHAARLLPPIITRLRAALRDSLGKTYCDGLAARVGVFTQGHAGMPGALNLSLMMVCHGLFKAFDMDSYMKRMAGNLSWPGDWCAGGSLDVLRGKDEHSDEMKKFRAAIAEAGGGGKEDPLGADGLLKSLRELEQAVPAKNPKPGILKKLGGKVYAYILWWIVTAAKVGGFSQAKEYGAMPKTEN